MSASRDRSTARAITWGFWWRKAINYLFFDVFLVAVVLLAIVLGYLRTLPEGTLGEGQVIPIDSTLALATEGDLASLEYGVSVSGETVTFPLGKDAIAMWPVLAIAVAVQTIDLLGVAGDARRVRRSLKPLNDLALRAEELGSADLTSPDKIESLEQAIGRASVEAPVVTTGDSDLASIEIALNRLLRQMQEAKLQQMRFVNDASHELRTPIAVIQGYVGMLERWGNTDPEVWDEAIAALSAESAHMQELVEQLLFLARGDSGRNALQRVRVNLAGIAVEVWEESSMIDPDHVYELGFDEGLASDARYEVMGDIAMLKQCLRIVSQNAAKYSDAGTAIRFGVDVGGAGVSVSVTDHGIGMSAEAATHAFDRFYRADNARDTGAEGSGLGLSIAKWIADSHGAAMGVTSVEGVGTRMTLTVPSAH